MLEWIFWYCSAILPNLLVGEANASTLMMHKLKLALG